MKLDRLIGILSILLQQDKATMPELAKTFEVSRRTISRDIDVLARAGIPISATQGAGGGVSIMSGYRIDRTLLTSSELQAILAGLRSLDSVSNTNRYGQLMEKLAGPNILASGRILIDLAAWHKQPLSHKIELLQSAISKGQTIAFHYYSPSGETDRIVEPYYIVFQWGAWYLWGWCQIRGDYRLFKLDRMSRLAFGQPFSSRPASYPNLSDDHVFPTRYQVEAIVPAKYKWKLVENYGVEYVVSPSWFFQGSSTFLIPDLLPLIQPEREALGKLQLEDGGFDISWVWHTPYKREFQQARKWWRPRVTMEKLLFYRQFAK